MVVSYEVYKAVERVFLYTPHRLVSTWAVVQCDSSSSFHTSGLSRLKTSKHDALGSSAKKSCTTTTSNNSTTGKSSRVVCVTVQRHTSGKPGYKASLQVLQASGKGRKESKNATVGGANDGRSRQGFRGMEYEVKKKYRLKYVSGLEVCNGGVCVIRFQGMGFPLKQQSVAFDCGTEEVRRELLGVVYSFCRGHEGVEPVLVGLTRGDLGEYGELLEDEEKENAVERDHGQASQSPEQEQDDVEDAYRSRNEPRRSATDDGVLHKSNTTAMKQQSMEYGVGGARRTMTAMPLRHGEDVHQAAITTSSINIHRADVLLDAVSDGASSLEDACRIIQCELQAMDDANIHELLESDETCLTRIGDGVFATLGYLDDVDETITMFDLKLRHMRDTLSTIDDSSRYLEHHSRNTGLLLESMTSLLVDCTLSPDVEHVLIHNDISMRHMDRIRAMCTKLHGKIAALQGMSKELQSMKVVKESLKEMTRIQSEFLKRAVVFVDSEIASVLRQEAVSSHIQVHMHEKVATVAPLLELVHMIDHSAAERSILQYIDATNGLLVKDVKQSLRAVQLSVGDDGGKGNRVGKQLMTRVDSMSALERVHSQSMQQKGALRHSVVDDVSQESQQLQQTEDDVFGKIQGTEVSTLFSNLVSSLVPQCSNEIVVLVDLLDRSGVTMNKESAARSLLQGIGPLLSKCVTSITSSVGLSCLDMTATIQTYMMKLRNTESLFSYVVSDMLMNVFKDCQAYWNSFIDDIDSTISKYDVRGGIMSNAKHGGSIHILPFVCNFERLANKMEALVAEWVAKDGSLTPSKQSPKASSPFQEDSDKACPNAHSDALIPGTTVRTMADALYQRVLPCIFSVIDGVATEYEKHQERIKLENYAFLRISLQALPIKSSPTLKQYCTAAAEGRNSAIKSYIQTILKQSGMENICLVTDGRHDDADATLLGNPADFEAALIGVKRRITKDLGDGSYLVHVVWERVDAKVMQYIDAVETAQIVDAGLCADGRLALTNVRCHTSSP